ncbi:inositol monophosphatase family protein [Pilimelia columellifera]|uniref:Inositol monophosphatase family protein n=1 Tax=Pilimelia columellifera subsp. columellifera TaxID=706583 RepID=A0ABN3NDN2_9ACTN
MLAEVAPLIRRTAQAVVLPYYRRLAAADIRAKGVGDIVTVADHLAERMLTDGLREILPGSRVVGEEAVSDDPTVLDALRGAGPVWLVDPVDGTANFAAGAGAFMMLIALLRAGAPEQAWLFDPLTDAMATASRGGGAFVDEAPARVAPVSASSLRGAVSARSLPSRIVARARAGGLGELLPGLRCTGREYPDIVSGAQDFAMFWWTQPWDHAAGSLFLAEAGGVARRLDGAPYDPTDNRQGLLAAADETVWRRVRDVVADEVGQGRPKP